MDRLNGIILMMVGAGVVVVNSGVWWSDVVVSGAFASWLASAGSLAAFAISLACQSLLHVNKDCKAFPFANVNPNCTILIKTDLDQNRS